MGNKFIFPIPRSSYKIDEKDPTLRLITYKGKVSRLIGKKCCKYEEKILKIPCRYLPFIPENPYLIIFFHGNSEDIGPKLTKFLTVIGQRFFINILCPEYPHYGAHRRTDTSLNMEQKIIQTSREVVFYATEVLGYKLENIILVGRSLGSGVAVKLATEFRFSSIILISPYTSIRDVAKKIAGKLLSKLVSNYFNSISQIENILCPVLFIHGKKDALIPYRMSEDLYSKSRTPKEMKINEEMSHNQFRLESELFAHMEEFMINKLKMGQHLWGIDTGTNIGDSIHSKINMTHQSSHNSQITVNSHVSQNIINREDSETLNDHSPLKTTLIQIKKSRGLSEDRSQLSGF